MANTESYSDEILVFINDTKDGKYSMQKPDLTHISYARLDIQESGIESVLADSCEEMILYGVSC